MGSSQIKFYLSIIGMILFLSACSFLLNTQDDGSKESSSTGSSSGSSSSGSSDGGTGSDSSGSSTSSSGSSSGSTTESSTGTGGSESTAIKTVFVVLMENHNWVDIVGSSSAPYINNTLLPLASYAQNYKNPTAIHPSLPNYLWLEAGASFGVADDANPSSHHQSTHDHLVAYLDTAGVSWKTYQEDIDGLSCPLSNVNSYKPKHNPFIYFDDVTNTNDTSSAYCISHVRPYTELASDLTNSTVAQYNFITPNICNDMHDSCAPTNDPIKQGDDWLAVLVPQILNSTAYTDHGALLITWDEGEGGSDGPIGMIVLSPLAKGGGYTNTIAYDHSSTLKTLQEIFGVDATLLGGAATATDLSDLFTGGF